MTIKDDDDGGFMDMVELFLGLLGMGQPFAAIFGDGGVTLKDIITLLVNEIDAVFRMELESEAARDAAATAQAVTDWFSNSYAPLQASGAGNPALLAALNGGVITDQIASLQQSSIVMESWSADSATDLAQQTATLALLMQGLLVGYYREIGLATDDPNAKEVAQNSLKLYAAQAVQRVTPLYQSVAQARPSGVTDVAQAGSEFVAWGYVRDTWVGDPPPPVLNDFRELNDGSVLFFNTSSGNDGPANVIASMTKTRNAYLSLLQTGSDADAATLSASLLDGLYPGESDFPSASGQDLVTNSVPKFKATGQWLTKAPLAIGHLQAMASG